LIGREAAAAYVCVSTNTFDDMVADGRMPLPKRVSDRRKAWDVRELDAAVDKLPHVSESGMRSDETWSDVDAPQPLFVELWRDRHGKVRLCFRKERGRRIPLPAIGSDDFYPAYEAALLRQPNSVRSAFIATRQGRSVPL
jgi:predicted DNA-binding transcriptional regulator AlpA